MVEKIEELFSSDMPKKIATKYAFDEIKQSVYSKKIFSKLDKVKANFLKEDFNEELMYRDIKSLLEEICDYQKSLMQNLEQMYTVLDNIMEKVTLVMDDEVILYDCTDYLIEKIRSTTEEEWDEIDEIRLSGFSENVPDEIKEEMDYFVLEALNICIYMVDIVNGVTGLSVIFAENELSEKGLERLYGQVDENEAIFDKIEEALYGACADKCNELYEDSAKEYIPTMVC